MDLQSRDKGMEHRVCVAPMMDHTNRHCRYFFRLIASKVGLYTEMITARAILHGDADRLLAFDPVEHPVALQLGGSNPGELAQAAASVRDGFRYDEINLNVGCPSDRVQSGRFGACLMDEPALVAECVAAISEAWGRPATVKTRIGIDDRDDYEFLTQFVTTVAAAGCRTFIVHARKAYLQGLSPKENRSVPPLRYDTVTRLKQDFPDLDIILNGGINEISLATDLFGRVDGLMIGRQACVQPYFLAQLQATLIEGRETPSPITRADVVQRMAAYAARECARGVRLQQITRHMLGLYAGQPGAARWRRFLSERAVRPGAGPELLTEALEFLPAAA